MPQLHSQPLTAQALHPVVKLQPVAWFLILILKELFLIFFERCFLTFAIIFELFIILSQKLK
jgi:hypothetical protein